ncbi:MAG TPA: helix-turn-helix transcriptional regulator [Anaerolineales bacterium]
MSLWQRLLRALGYKPATRLSFHMDQELARSLQELAAREQRQAGEVAADLISSALAERHAGGEMLERWLRLSAREQQVAALVCLQYTNRQIAARLIITPETAKTHVRNVLRKFGLRSKEQLRRELAEWDFSDWLG